MPYWKDAPSVKPEVFLSLSAPFFAHSVKDAEPHTLVWIRALRLEHLKKHSHLSDPDGGELLLKICGRQPSRRDSRARFLAALVPKYRPRARLVLLFLLPRVLPG